MAERPLRRYLLIAAIMCGIALTPPLLVLAYVGYYVMVPRYMAVAFFDEYAFNLRLDLFLTEDQNRDSGRYLSVITPTASHTFMLPGPDWAHRARTSIYLIDAGHLAVLSALGYDCKITITPFATAPVVSDDGAQWQYLGAFDFIFPSRERPRLEFFDRRLAECIPMVGNPDQWADKPRAAARRATCPTPASP